ARSKRRGRRKTRPLERQSGKACAIVYQGFSDCPFRSFLWPPLGSRYRSLASQTTPHWYIRSPVTALYRTWQKRLTVNQVLSDCPFRSFLWPPLGSRYRSLASQTTPHWYIRSPVTALYRTWQKRWSNKGVLCPLKSAPAERTSEARTKYL